MAISKVQIINMALSNLGTRNTVESLTENSTEAKTANIWYDQSRLLALEAYDWNFAKKRIALALSSEDPPEGIWEYRYLYPADCVRARKIQKPEFLNRPVFNTTDIFDPIFPDPDAIPFHIEMASNGEEKTILTDLEDAILVYTFNQQNTGLYTNFFVQTLSYVLAFNMAIQLTGRKSIKDDMLAAYNYLLGQASQHDANERVDRAPRDAEMIRARA